MKLWQGRRYKDDRLFILDLQLAKKKGKRVWAVVTRRNVDGFPPFRVDDFATQEEAIAFIERIEPETPRISCQGESPVPQLQYGEYVASLQKEGLPSAMDIYVLNRNSRGELVIDELSQDDLLST